MTNIVPYRQFSDAGATDHTKKSFQHTEFFKIQANHPGRPLNFYRSDFRGALFRESNFIETNFNNADFVGATISKCSFFECTFQSSAFVDSVLEKTAFHKNRKISYEIIRCRLSDVTFLDENLFRAVLRNSEFYDCKFINTKITRSSLEDISFEECRFGGLNLVPVYAVDLRFRKCDMSGVSIDPDYMGSYLFDKESFDGVRFGYKGKQLKFDFFKDEDRFSFIRHLTDNGRLIDVANVTLLSAHVLGSRNPTSRIVCAAVDQVLSVPNSLTAAYGIRRIWYALKFYSELQAISISDLIDIHKHFSNIAGEGRDILVQTEIRNAIAGVARSITDVDVDTEQFDKNTKNRLAIAEFEFDTNDNDEAVQILTKMLDEFIVNREVVQNQSFYKITRIRQGSIIIEVVMALVLIQLVVSTIRRVNIEFQQILIDSTYSKKMRSLMKRASTVKELSIASNAHAKIQSRNISEIRKDIKIMLLKLKSIRIGFDDA